MSASDDARKAIAVQTAPISADPLAAVMPDGRTIAQWLDEVDRLRAENAVAERLIEWTIDYGEAPISFVSTVHTGGRWRRFVVDEDHPDGGEWRDLSEADPEAAALLARLEAAPLAVPDVQVRDRSAVVARTRRQQRE